MSERPAPQPGRHTDAVLIRRQGLTPTQLQTYKDHGVLG
ncbi:hypothetical protein SAMN05421875_104108 [Acidovorax soli]|uniref:Uncharacterized protein n=1 Tax=Acidovorax soli TaxID=592050 RepID=A0A1H3XUT2_9BURK|nr:hypothetical protein SAMN05421875_104108 [Acidovorax soli]